MEERIRDLEIKVTKIGGDVEHIKSRIDNGMSGTITKIFERLDTYLPQVKDNTYWVGKFKQAIWWIATIGIGGGIISLIFFFIKKGIG